MRRYDIVCLPIWWCLIILYTHFCETFVESSSKLENITKKTIQQTNENQYIKRLELFTYASNQYTTIKGGIETQEKLNKRRKISRKRNMVDHFISSSDSNILEKYIESRKGTLSMTYPGNYARSVQDFHLNPSAVIEEDIFEETKLLLYTVFKATDYIESFFNSDLRYDNIAVSLRDLPGLVYQMNLQRTAKKQYWCHEFHSDYCSAGDEHSNGRIVCLKGSEKKDRQYTAALYFNEIEGGEFAFIDVSPNKKVEGRKLSSPTINQKVNISSELQRHRRNLAAKQPKIKLAHPKNTVSPNTFQSPYVQKYATTTLYPPKPGRLVMFSSGVENVHAVTEILSKNRSRNMINFWFTPADYTYELPGTFWTGCKLTNTESCHALANFSA